MIIAMRMGYTQRLSKLMVWGFTGEKFDTTRDDSVSVAPSHSGLSDEMQISLLNEALLELSWTVITYLNQSLTGRDGDIAS